MIAIKRRGLGKLLILLAGTLLAATVSCGGGGGGTQRLAEAAGTNQNDGIPDVSIVYNRGYQVSTSNGTNLSSVDLLFTSGQHEVYILSDLGTCSSPTKDSLQSIKLMSKSGDYWYFDNAGNPIPDEKGISGLLSKIGGGGGGGTISTTPVVKISVSGGSTSKRTGITSTVVVSVSSTVVYSEVKVATATGTVLTYNTSATSGSYDTQTTNTVDAVRVTLAADGSKWYFDSAGNVLPADSKWYTDLD